MPASIVIRSLAPQTKLANTSPFISTREDLRDGSRTGGTVPSAPALTLSATASTITATITNSQGATGYEIRLENGSAVAGLRLTGLAPETEYSVQVRGLNEYGAGAWSGAVSQATLAASGAEVSGGTPELAWTAQNGLFDQQTITLTSDTHTLTAPAKQNWLGFGEGFLYEQPDGSAFADTIDVGGETWNIETVAEGMVRQVKQSAGLRWAHTVLHKASLGSQPTGAGFIAWDTGSEIPPGEHIFMYSMAEMDGGSKPGSTFQWKQDRIRADRYLVGSGDNSNYATETTPGGSGERFISYQNPNEASVGLYTSVPKHENGPSRFFWSWTINTPDVADGALRSVCLDSYETGLSVRNPTNSNGDSADGTVRGAVPERPRWAQWQDYVGNNDNGAQDISVQRTDMFVQRGGVIVFLADHADPEQVTKIVPLRFVGQNGNALTLKLWGQNAINYDSAAVLIYDGKLNFIKGVSLSGGV